MAGGYSPFGLLKIVQQQQQLTLSALEVIARRTASLSQGTMSDHEAVSMIFEKPTAVAKGMENAAKAIVSGRGPLAATIEFYAPMANKASSNAKRLRR